MRLILTVSALLVGFAFCDSATAWAASNDHQTPVIDLALTEFGDFVSQCQDATGQAIDGAAVGLYRDGDLVAQATSGEDGWFRFARITPGPYVLRSNGWQNPVRLWPWESVPPAGQDPIVLILKQSTPTSSKSRIRQVVAGLETGPAFAAIDPEPANPPRLPEIETDAPFDPFPPPAPAANPPVEPSPDVAPEMLPPAEPQVIVTEETVPYPPAPQYPAPQYVVGPTVGDVVTTSVGIAGLTVGVVALYKYERRSEGSRSVVSP